jgi:hypothetical protein
MRLDWNDIKARAAKFVENWNGGAGACESSRP